MPYYELVDGKSRKFWWISRKGASLTTRYGRIGAAGQTTTKTFSSPQAAKVGYGKLIGQKVAKGYVLTAKRRAPPKARARRLSPKEVEAFERRIAKVARSNRPKARRAWDGPPQQDSVGAAFQRAAESLATVLKLPALEIKRITFEKRRLTVALKNRRRVVGALSAPRGLVAALWKDVRDLEHRLFAVPGKGYAVGDWDLLRRTLTCDDDFPKAHADWMALADAVRKRGSRKEAQLVWMQASDFGLANQRSAEFKAMFPTLPKSAGIAGASSCAAFLTRMAPFAKSRTVIDRFVALRAFVDDLVEALIEIEGKRKDRFVKSLCDMLVRLEADSEPCIRELARLLRAQCAVLIS